MNLFSANKKNVYSKYGFIFHMRSFISETILCKGKKSNPNNKNRNPQSNYNTNNYTSYTPPTWYGTHQQQAV